MEELITEEFVLEYYSRELDYHGIGTFHQLNNEPIQRGDKFIVPRASLLCGKSTSGRQDWVGCSEGRENHPAFLKPLLLICKGTSANHVTTTNGSGAYRKDLCYIEKQ